MNASSKARTGHLNSQLLPQPAVTAATEANDAPRYPRPLISKAYRVLLSIVAVLLASQLFRLILGPGEGRFTDASRKAPPMHAASALHKCSLLEVESGRPAEFASRKRSDRAIPGTKATLITVGFLRLIHWLPYTNAFATTIERCDMDRTRRRARGPQGRHPPRSGVD